jgi:hypothetical protein
VPETRHLLTQCALKPLEVVARVQRFLGANPALTVL